MPIYEYTCDSCGHELEALQGLNDDLLSDCPECGQSALRKRISRVAFRLKGSGWYETDFKDKDKRNVAGESGGESGQSSGGETGASSQSSSDSGSGSGGSSGESGSSSESKGKGGSGTSSGGGSAGSGVSSSGSSGSGGSSND
jgi:putative FmdB family regulatory protein